MKDKFTEQWKEIIVSLIQSLDKSTKNNSNRSQVNGDSLSKTRERNTKVCEVPDA